MKEAPSAERLELAALEASGEYVFHGSGDDLIALEPRQAIDTKKGPDGPPAVFASNKADYAIFMAIVNKENCPHGSRSRAGARSGVLSFGMTPETAKQLTDEAGGYVYVFDKAQFTPRERGGVEYVSYERVEPVRKIRVGKRDLPDNITLFEGE